jgi:hypothetical protein
MSKNQDFELLRMFIECDQRWRNSAREEAVKRIQVIPVSEEFLNQLLILSPGDFHKVIRSHPGYELDYQIRSLEATLNTFRHSFADLKERLIKFRNHVPSKLEKQSRLELEKMLRSISKEVFCLSSAAKALVEHARHLRGKLIPCKEYDNRRLNIFETAEHEFVVSLRNNLNHHVFFMPQWNVRYTPGSRDTQFSFDCAELLAHGEFNGEAQKFMSQAGPRINIESLFSSYVQRVDSFYNWLFAQIESQLPTEILDYRRCVSTHRIAAKRIWYRLLLHTAIQWGTDPYAHLAKYLTETEISEIQQLPNGSVAQVNRLIEIVDTDGVADKELRQLMFRLFKVDEKDDPLCKVSRNHPQSC